MSTSVGIANLVQDRLKRTLSTATRERAFKRRLPSELGGARFYASTEGGLKFLRPKLGTIDSVLTDFARKYVRPGACVWDVGANVGLFTFAAAGLSGNRGRVVAFEPDPWLASLLRRGNRINRTLSRVDVLCAAVSAETGISRFQIANQSRACSALEGYGNAMHGVREELFVLTTTLDQCMTDLPIPDVVKIDTEGAELAVLLGATELLQKARPTMLIEVNEGNRAEVGQLLVAAGYELLDAETGQQIAEPTFNTICIAH